MHREGEAGPTSTPTPPSRPPRPQSSSPGNLASVLPKASPPGGVPNPPPPCQRILSAGGWPREDQKNQGGWGGVRWGEVGWRRGEEEETGLSGCCRPRQCPRSGRDAPSRRGRAALGPPSLAPPSPAPVGNFRLRLPRQPWPRGMPQGTGRQGRRRKETHRDTHARTHARIHDGCRHPIHLWLYSLGPCPGCRATCGGSGVWASPSPAHRLGYLC